MAITLILSGLLNGDAGKFAILTLAIVALYVLARVISRRNDSRGFPAAHGSIQEGFGVDPGASDSIRVHEPMRFDTIELKKFYMREFDVVGGPPDPFEFVDELTAEVEHLASGNRSTWEFTIGTPSGFARLLERKNWESFYSPEIFVIRKYEVEMVREMIVEHISAVLENKPSGEDELKRDFPKL